MSITDNSKFFFNQPNYISFKESLARLITSERDLLSSVDAKDIAANIEEQYSLLMSPNFRSTALLFNAFYGAFKCAFRSLDIKAGDEVIISSLCHVDLVMFLIEEKVHPVVVDIEYNGIMSIHDIRKKISPKCKAIIASYPDGLICDIESLDNLTKEYNLLLIEEMINGFGAEFRAKEVGYLGDLAIVGISLDNFSTLSSPCFLLTQSEENYTHLINTYNSLSKESLSNHFLLDKLSSFILCGYFETLVKQQLQRKENKKKLVDCILKSDIGDLDLILGFDANGDASNAIYIEFSEPKVAMQVVKYLLCNNIACSRLSQHKTLLPLLVLSDYDESDIPSLFPTYYNKIVGTIRIGISNQWSEIDIVNIVNFISEAINHFA